MNDARHEVEARLAMLEQHLTELRAENAELRAEVAALRPVSVSPERVRPRDVDDASAEPTADDRRVTRRGVIAAVAGAAGGLLLAQATPAAAADGEALRLGQLNYASTATSFVGKGLTVVSTGILPGLSGSNSTKGVSGLANASVGIAYGVLGRAESTSGSGVGGVAAAATGVGNGVYGRANSASGRGVYGANSGTTGLSGGYAIFADGRLKSTGRAYFGTPNSAPADSDLHNGSVSLYLDQAANTLKVRVKYSTGEVKTGTIALA